MVSLIYQKINQFSTLRSLRPRGKKFFKYVLKNLHF